MNLYEIWSSLEFPLINAHKNRFSTLIAIKCNYQICKIILNIFEIWTKWILRILNLIRYFRDKRLNIRSNHNNREKKIAKILRGIRKHSYIHIRYLNVSSIFYKALINLSWLRPCCNVHVFNDRDDSEIGRTLIDRSGFVTITDYKALLEQKGGKREWWRVQLFYPVGVDLGQTKRCISSNQHSWPKSAITLIRVELLIALIFR